MPLASEISIGAMVPKNTEGMKEETKEIRAVAPYSSGFFWRSYQEFGSLSLSIVCKMNKW